ncbi:MAG TPA: NAD(P)/FAD-dependent oxidoreductase [Pseudonocardia sp.]|jgi:cation diffusion facilitator CzcD-associated flavoprotein CzcO|nr:NAD(P)/FAD-dependent oxidoreductase [Pseudonocardia sp.]
MSDRNGASELDAIVVGAGFGGIYQLYKLREQGLRVRAYDRAGGVGGTWYWNRYPGAKSDTESFVYRYSFDRDLLQDWDWTTRYLDQPEILDYLEHVVDRFDLRKDIQLNTGIESAVFDEDHHVWQVTTDTGEKVTARYLVTALGLLSRINWPDIPGRDSFAGELLHTGAWPTGHDLTGKRVGVIGTGSTGTQFICAASKIAGHLTVFQRSAQYSVPSGNGPVTPEEVAEAKENFDAIWEQVRGSNVAFGFVESDVPAMSVSEEERQRVFQENWDKGNGFRFMFGTFNDIAIDPDANKAACDFIRSKIGEIVKDPETARKLMPTDVYAKRPLCNEDYYEIYNRDNVSLVSVKENPITEVTPAGVRTADGAEHELDVLVFATGFDAVDGNYNRMDLRGRGGQLISEHWRDAPTSYLGVSTSGFPNLFMVLGPHGPFTNLPPSIETQIDWISDLIAEAERTGTRTVEVREKAEKDWVATCHEISDQTLFSQADSWIFGANIPGKTQTVLFYMAGLGAYRQKLADESGSGYAGFELQGARQAAGQPS